MVTLSLHNSLTQPQHLPYCIPVPKHLAFPSYTSTHPLPPLSTITDHSASSNHPKSGPSAPPIPITGLSFIDPKPRPVIVRLSLFWAESDAKIQHPANPSFASVLSSKVAPLRPKTLPTRTAVRVRTVDGLNETVLSRPAIFKLKNERKAKLDEQATDVECSVSGLSECGALENDDFDRAVGFFFESVEILADLRSPLLVSLVRLDEEKEEINTDLGGLMLAVTGKGQVKLPPPRTENRVQLTARTNPYSSSFDPSSLFEMPLFAFSLSVFDLCVDEQAPRLVRIVDEAGTGYALSLAISTRQAGDMWDEKAGKKNHLVSITSSLVPSPSTLSTSPLPPLLLTRFVSNLNQHAASMGIPLPDDSNKRGRKAKQDAAPIPTFFKAPAVTPEDRAHRYPFFNLPFSCVPLSLFNLHLAQGFDLLSSSLPSRESLSTTYATSLPRAPLAQFLHLTGRDRPDSRPSTANSTGSNESTLSNGGLLRMGQDQTPTSTLTSPIVAVDFLTHAGASSYFRIDLPRSVVEDEESGFVFEFYVPNINGDKLGKAGVKNDSRLILKAVAFNRLDRSVVLSPNRSIPHLTRRVVRVCPFDSSLHFQPVRIDTRLVPHSFFTRQPPALQFNPIRLQSKQSSNALRRRAKEGLFIPTASTDEFGFEDADSCSEALHLLYPHSVYKEEGQMSSSTLHSQIEDPLFRISPFLARTEVKFNKPPFIVPSNHPDRYQRLVVSGPKAKKRASDAPSLVERLSTFVQWQTKKKHNLSHPIRNEEDAERSFDVFRSALQTLLKQHFQHETLSSEISSQDWRKGESKFVANFVENAVQTEKNKVELEKLKRAAEESEPVKKGFHQRLAEKRQEVEKKDDDDEIPEVDEEKLRALSEVEGRCVFIVNHADVIEKKLKLNQFDDLANEEEEDDECGRLRRLREKELLDRARAFLRDLEQQRAEEERRRREREEQKRQAEMKAKRDQEQAIVDGEDDDELKLRRRMMENEFGRLRGNETKTGANVQHRTAFRPLSPKPDKRSLTPPDLSDTLMTFHANETRRSIVLPEETRADIQFGGWYDKEYAQHSGPSYRASGREDSDDAAFGGWRSDDLGPGIDDWLRHPTQSQQGGGKKGRADTAPFDLDAVPKSPPNKKRRTELARELQERKTKTELLIDETVLLRSELRMKEIERMVPTTRWNIDKAKADLRDLRMALITTKERVLKLIGEDKTLAREADERILIAATKKDKKKKKDPNAEMENAAAVEKNRNERTRVQLELGRLKGQEEEYEAREKEGERALSALQADLDSLLSEYNTLQHRIVQTKGQQHAAQNKLGRLHHTPFPSPADVTQARTAPAQSVFLAGQSQHPFTQPASSQRPLYTVPQSPPIQFLRVFAQTTPVHTPVSERSRRSAHSSTPPSRHTQTSRMSQRSLKAIILSESPENQSSLSIICKSLEIEVLDVISDPDALFSLESLFRSNLLIIDSSAKHDQYPSLVSTIRQNSDFVDLPILAVYTSDSFSATVNLLTAGASDAIALPTDASSFSDALTVFFRKVLLTQSSKLRSTKLSLSSDPSELNIQSLVPTEETVWHLTSLLFQTIREMVPFSQADVHSSAITFKLETIRDAIEECLVCIEFNDSVPQPPTAPSSPISSSPVLNGRSSYPSGPIRSPIHSHRPSLAELTTKRILPPTESLLAPTDGISPQPSTASLSGASQMESFAPKAWRVPNTYANTTQSITTLTPVSTADTPSRSTPQLPQIYFSSADLHHIISSSNDSLNVFPSLQSTFLQIHQSERLLCASYPSFISPPSPFTVEGFELTRLAFVRLNTSTCHFDGLLSTEVIVPVLATNTEETTSPLPSSLIQYKFKPTTSTDPIPITHIFSMPKHHRFCTPHHKPHQHDGRLLHPLPQDILSLEFDSLLYTTEELKLFLITILSCLNFSSQTQFKHISVVAGFVECVCSLYSPFNAYHNFHHAFDVTQMVLALLHNIPGTVVLFSDLHVFVLVLACICHDVEHPGNNNVFQANSTSLAAQLTNNQSIIESYSIIRSWSLFTNPAISPFGDCLSPPPALTPTGSHVGQMKERKKEKLKGLQESFRTLFIQCILATDMAEHVRYVQRLGFQSEAIADKLNQCAQKEREWVKAFMRKDAEEKQAKGSSQSQSSETQASATTSPNPPPFLKRKGSQPGAKPLLRRSTLLDLTPTLTITHYLSLQPAATRPSMVSLRDAQLREETDSDLLLLIMKVLIKCADISNMSRGFPIALKWSERMMHEMLHQKQLEEKIKLPISVNTKPFAEMEVGFSVFVVEPFFTLVDKALPAFNTLYANLQHNIARWKDASAGNKTFAEILKEDPECVCDPLACVKQVRRARVVEDRVEVAEAQEDDASEFPPVEQTCSSTVSVFRSDLVLQFV
ncbi:putative 3'5'-cyclic nucleotide phosphodiesterase [Blattamonas nauphoetae]|uniref:Phosphodiesterase n=1 Tax=Blattamonas nauphoetae TaxID=2049346 RepID=A0ABQ9XL72_9EUKA|nr:putative 3'5'-cyclic nucleotide phosphodiesterase [Blattamonas nauphoetae]